MSSFFGSLLHDATRPPQPLNSAEAYFVWGYYVAVNEARELLLVMLNHTQDTDLKEVMEHFIDDLMEPEIGKLKELMVKEKIALPEITPDTPKAKAEEIPVGARLRDVQIARMLVVKVQGLLEFAQFGLRFSERTDVGAMFHRFQNQVLAQGYSLRDTMLRRGWMPKTPPFHAP